ncbi:AIPR family protein [Saccharothrix sp. HUAS TT1]|uniref:AIPR family protein n=1 Tax=unclassified Saccharothrix TaxID=2593673 RepID=UPI00345BA906
MATNDLVLIDQVLEQRAEESQLPPAKVFEIFACEQAVTLGDLTLEEVENGIVGGAGDGAVDGVYLFLNDRLLAADDHLVAGDVPSGSKLVLWLVQAKLEKSFTETAIDLAASSTRRLLDLSESEQDLLELYGEDLVERIGVFRKTLKSLVRRQPQVEVRFTYVTRGDTARVNAKVLRKAKDLEKDFADRFTGGSGYVEFLGAAELWQRSSKIQSHTLVLPYQESITHGTSHIALVRLRDYLDFLSDNDGLLRRHIFDLNVRDFAGSVEVNREIKQSLLEPKAPQFWWLNNGVTIICSKVWTVGGKVFSLDDVQVVNGLQTSHTIHQTLTELLDVDPNHPSFDNLVQVRILRTDDAAERDQVIRATNRQTKVPDASLHATDENQRKIETYFFDNGWFYDRRKNYYRNLGKPTDRIVSIPSLAQSLMAMGFSQPDNSRARPSSLLKDSVKYKKLFPSTVPLAVYLWLARQQRLVDVFLAAEVSASDRTNLRFHLAMLSAANLLGSRVHSPQMLGKPADEEIHSTPEELRRLLVLLRDELARYAEEKDQSYDKIAKGPDFVEIVLKAAGY